MECSSGEQCQWRESICQDSQTIRVRILLTLFHSPSHSHSLSIYLTLPLSLSLCMFYRYITGDLVLFNPIRLPESKTTVPIILHAEKPAPFLFMEPVSYAGFGIKPGRV